MGILIHGISDYIILLMAFGVIVGYILIIWSAWEDSKPKCKGQNDVAIWVTKVNGTSAPYGYAHAATSGADRFWDDSFMCGMSCWGEEKCVSNCVQKKEGYTDECSTCFGKLAGCIVDYCMDVCQETEKNADGKACTQCTAARCVDLHGKKPDDGGIEDDFKTCTGFETMPPLPVESWGSASVLSKDSIVSNANPTTTTSTSATTASALAVSSTADAATVHNRIEKNDFSLLSLRGAGVEKAKQLAGEAFKVLVG